MVVPPKAVPAYLLGGRRAQCVVVGVGSVCGFSDKVKNTFFEAECFGTLSYGSNLCGIHESEPNRFFA